MTSTVYDMPLPEKGHEVVLEVARDPALVRTVRLVAAAFARRCGMQKDTVEDVRLAVGEACAVMIGTDETVSAEGVLEIRLTHDAGLRVRISGATGPQQQVLSDLGLDPWAIMRGLFEGSSVVEQADEATVQLHWAS